MYFIYLLCVLFTFLCGMSIIQYFQIMEGITVTDQNWVKTEIDKIKSQLATPANISNEISKLNMSQYATPANISNEISKLNMSQYATPANISNEISKLNLSQYAKATDVTALKSNPLFNNTFQSQIEATNNNINTNIMPAVNYYNTNNDSLNKVIKFYNKNVPLD